MNLFEEIQKYYSHNISSSDIQMLEMMKKDYSDNDILQLFKNYPGKPISYIYKIKPIKKEQPEWLDKDIKEELLTKEEIIPILIEWKKFFDNDEEYKVWYKKQLSYVEVQKCQQ